MTDSPNHSFIVGILETVMEKTSGKSLLDYQELTTVLYEVENFPIEVPAPLYFLTVSREDSLEDSRLSPRVRKSELLARWRRREQAGWDMWTRWEKGYLALLRNFRHSETIQSSEVEEVKLVIIGDKSKAKLFRLLCWVKTVNFGRDGPAK